MNQWIMISDNGETLSRLAFKVTAPDLECMDDCKAFLLSGGVIDLCRDELSALKSNRASILHEYSTEAKVTCISDQLKGLVEIW